MEVVLNEIQNFQCYIEKACGKKDLIDVKYYRCAVNAVQNNSDSSTYMKAAVRFVMGYGTNVLALRLHLVKPNELVKKERSILMRLKRVLRQCQ